MILVNRLILMSAFVILTINIAYAKTYTVKIEQDAKKFKPEKLTINAGDTVKWVNTDDSIPVHPFTSVPGSYSTEKPEIEIQELHSGDSWEHTFNIEGRYSYFCFVHRSMTGEIIVKKVEKKK